MPALGEMAWPEVRARGRLVAVPLGSCEQHGPHLPLDTDSRIALACALGLADTRDDVLVAPLLGYGASGEHAGFAGSLSLGTRALATVLVELVRSADGTADGVVLVNGHGGNTAAVRAAAALGGREGRRVLAWSPTTSPGHDGSDLHAGRPETSLLLHLAPHLVRADLAVAGPVPPLSALRRDGVLPHSPTGVLGDPAGANAAEGAALLARLVADLVATVAAWAPERVP